jgi:hypothetical protein
MQRRATILAVSIGFLCLGVQAARADFCLQADDGFGGPTVAFFRFGGKYSTKSGKVKSLVGHVTAVASGSVVGLGPAFGASFGLPEGDAGVALSAQFSFSDTVGWLGVTLDDNGATQGGGAVYYTTLPTVSAFASIVDCATEPQP